MAGAFAGSGNTLPRSEANIWFDPEAAAEIFAAFEGRDRLPLAIGLDVTERVVLTSADVETICGPGSELGTRATDRRRDLLLHRVRGLRPPGGVWLPARPARRCRRHRPGAGDHQGSARRGGARGTPHPRRDRGGLPPEWRHPLNAAYGLSEAADNVVAAMGADEGAFLSRFVDRLRSLVDARS